MADTKKAWIAWLVGEKSFLIFYSESTVPLHGPDRLLIDQRNIFVYGAWTTIEDSISILTQDHDQGMNSNKVLLEEEWGIAMQRRSVLDHGLNCWRKNCNKMCRKSSFNQSQLKSMHSKDRSVLLTIIPLISPHNHSEPIGRWFEWLHCSIATTLRALFRHSKC